MALFSVPVVSERALCSLQEAQRLVSRTERELQRARPGTNLHTLLQSKLADARRELDALQSDRMILGQVCISGMRSSMFRMSHSSILDFDAVLFSPPAMRPAVRGCLVPCHPSSFARSHRCQAAPLNAPFFSIAAHGGADRRRHIPPRAVEAGPAPHLPPVPLPRLSLRGSVRRED